MLAVGMQNILGRVSTLTGKVVGSVNVKNAKEDAAKQISWLWKIKLGGKQ